MKDIQKLYYTKEYYSTHCGEPYENREVWAKKFKVVAQKIIDEYNPKTVLEIGCAMGYLVEALRDRGVEAYGIDISEYAISKVREDIKPYCRVASVLEKLPEDLPNRYDLVISIEVIEHLYEDQVNSAMDHLCKYSDQVIFSSSGEDTEEITHVNVQQQEYWAMKFAQRGFYRMLNSNLDYISNCACRYVKDNELIHTVYDYEKCIRETKNGWKKQVGEYEKVVSYLNNEIAQFKESMKKIEKELSEQEEANTRRIHQLKEEASNLAKAYEKELNKKEQELREKVAQSEIDIKENINKELEKSQKVSEQYKSQIEEQKQYIQELKAEISDYTKVAHYKIDEVDRLVSEKQNLVNELGIAKGEYLTVVNSTCWKITKPVRIILDAIKKVLKSNRVTALVYKGFIALRNEGVGTTARKVKNKLFNCKGQVGVVEPMQIQLPAQTNNYSTVETLLETRMRNLQKIPCIVSNENITRINFVTDSIEKHSLLGGVATALIVATEFANKYNVPLRIITRTTDINPSNYFSIMELSNVKVAKEVSFYSDFDRDINGDKVFKLDVTPSDIFMATSWWSAEAIKKTTLRKRFYYIIQEVETFFYSHGDEHYRCSQIMEDENIDYIINSHYLYDYFKEHNKNIVKNGIYFEPAFPKTIYSVNNMVRKDKYKLFFYARPNNPRNMFTYGLQILESCIQKGIIDTNEWDIYCAGQDVPELTFSNGYKVKNLGLMEWKEYGKFLGDIDLALSLMYTPHPSYPPFDVASAGGVVVSNKCINKENISFCNNILLGDLEEEKFLETMKQGIELAKDYKERKKNFEQSTIPTEWHQQLKDTIKFMGEKI